MFHGAGGDEAREAFRAEFDKAVPTTERAFLEAVGARPLFEELEPNVWRRAVGAAVAARDASRRRPAELAAQNGST